MAYIWDCPAAQVETHQPACENGRRGWLAGQANRPEPEPAAIEAEAWPRLPALVQEWWRQLHSRVSENAG